MLSLPEDSSIEISTDRDGHTRLLLPSARKGWLNHLGSLFLIVWLIMWTGAGFSAIQDISAGKSSPVWFLSVWLIFWAFGEAFAGLSLYRLLRPTIPASLILQKPELIYDTGVPGYQTSTDYRKQWEAWRKFFKGRQKITFSPADLLTLRLRDTDSSNRLTIDHGNQRIDIGSDITEVERELIFEYLKAEYRL